MLTQHGSAVLSSGEQVVVMVLLTLVIGGGLGLLIGLAVLIGQEQAQEHAWRRIAQERRELGTLKRALIEAAGSPECADCWKRLEKDIPW